MKRRKFLQFIGCLPFLGFLTPEKKDVKILSVQQGKLTNTYYLRAEDKIIEYEDRESEKFINYLHSQTDKKNL